MTTRESSLSNGDLGYTDGEALLIPGNRGRGDIIGGDDADGVGGVSTRSKDANQGTSVPGDLAVGSFANLSICARNTDKSERRTNRKVTCTYRSPESRELLETWPFFSRGGGCAVVRGVRTSVTFGVNGREGGGELGDAIGESDTFCCCRFLSYKVE